MMPRTKECPFTSQVDKLPLARLWREGVSPRGLIMSAHESEAGFRAASLLQLLPAHLGHQTGVTQCPLLG